MSSRVQNIFIFAIFAGSIFFSHYSSLHAQSAKEIKLKDLEYREYMVTISRQLGVTCLACHDTKNFASDEKREFRISKEHMKMTQSLIDAGFDGQKGRPKADCFMCHRGQLKPDYKEKFDPMTMEKSIHKVPVNQVPMNPASSPVETSETDGE